MSSEECLVTVQHTKKTVRKSIRVTSHDFFGCNPDIIVLDHQVPEDSGFAYIQTQTLHRLVEIMTILSIHGWVRCC